MATTQRSSCGSGSDEAQAVKDAPAQSQRMLLETHRQRSSIPRAGTNGDSGQSEAQEQHWVYPSEQQFYNALRRKGWHPDERDVPTVLRIHNQVNEACWQKIQRWESHAGEPSPQLVHFAGRGSTFSPKARMLNALGYTLPFDRHDWVVQRADGTSRRYVLDFYRGRGASQAMHLDIRPALDSPAAVLERVNGNARSLFRKRMPQAEQSQQQHQPRV